VSVDEPAETTVDDSAGHELGDIVISVTIPRLGCVDAGTPCAPVELPPTGLDAAALPMTLAVALLGAGAVALRQARRRSRRAR
jgi:hypothetical protein